MATDLPGTPITFREWFKGPPRAHGEVLEDRTVSFLELFYDLVFVVLIAQIAHTLAEDVSWVGVRNFSIVFALIWIAWLNGTFYHELHGREDGRNRTYIFVQMALLVVLAVYASHAADDVDDGRGFAIVYPILLTFIAGQWYSLRRYDSPAMAALTLRYVAGMAVTIALVLASAFVDSPDTRLALWTAAIVITVAGMSVQLFRSDPELEDAVRITESAAERFGLFTIIVLGDGAGAATGLGEAVDDADDDLAQ
ncbi:MAG: low temperature requirement protein A, partial [Actinomycetota bacterium]